MATNNIVQLFDKIVEQPTAVACDDCSLYSLCLPLGLNNQDLGRLDKIIDRNDSLPRGGVLFQAQMPFKSLYVVRSGSFKTTISTGNGHDQITGFYFPGEFIGLDAIYADAYQSTATALESSTLCALPFDRLTALGADIPPLQMHILRRSSKELANDKSLMLLLGKKSADAKLATYLLSLSARFQERGFSSTEFRLSMPRKDIANHLGLAVETISRLFTRFQKQNLITINNKHIKLLNLPQLKALCDK